MFPHLLTFTKMLCIVEISCYILLIREQQKKLYWSPRPLNAETIISSNEKEGSSITIVMCIYYRRKKIRSIIHRHSLQKSLCSQNLNTRLLISKHDCNTFKIRESISLLAAKKSVISSEQTYLLLSCFLKSHISTHKVSKPIVYHIW